MEDCGHRVLNNDTRAHKRLVNSVGLCDSHFVMASPTLCKDHGARLHPTAAHKNTTPLVLLFLLLLLQLFLFLLHRLTTAMCPDTVSYCKKTNDDDRTLQTLTPSPYPGQNHHPTEPSKTCRLRAGEALASSLTSSLRKMSSACTKHWK